MWVSWDAPGARRDFLTSRLGKGQKSAIIIVQLPPATPGLPGSRLPETPKLPENSQNLAASGLAQLPVNPGPLPPSPVLCFRKIN
tara:strand:- start:393 stop:647 length:255 start_codon:yes stop_codon:yes gene_type:complete